MTRKNRSHAADSFWASLFIAPGFGILLLCIIVPGILAFALSFTHTSRFGTIHWAGIYNYKKLFNDPIAAKSFLNTLVFVTAFVPLSSAISLGTALLLQPNFRGMRIIRSIYFVPAVLSSMVTVSIFRFLLDRNYGPVNSLLETLGFSGIPWLWDRPYAMISIIGLSLWKSAAFNSIILLAALQDVPKELHEAAQVDGAGSVRRLFTVTIPSIWPVLSALTILSTIGAFRVFEPMFVLTDGGPAYSTRSIALHAYLSAFRDGNLGYSSAVSFVLLAIILLATLVLNRARRLES